MCCANALMEALKLVCEEWKRNHGSIAPIIYSAKGKQSKLTVFMQTEGEFCLSISFM